MFEYMNYVRNLKFDEKPKYKYLRELFEEQMQEQEIEMDFQFDWIIQKQRILEEKQKAIEDAKIAANIAALIAQEKDAKKQQKNPKITNEM